MRAHRLGWVVLVATVVTGCMDVGARRAPVVYETDDRTEVYEHPSATHRAIAQTAVAMQMGAEWLDLTDPSDVRITYTQTLGEAHSLCSDVRYRDQIEPGTCSGTLIDERHILTAGHCVAAAEDCDGSSWPWVFGVYYEAAGGLRTLTADDVYFCTRTVVFRNDASGDYAVIELDRPVLGHEPAPVRRDTTDAPLGTEVTMIGHPNGIPMKIAGNATVRGVAGVELYADVDAFFGNSGSGVFDDGGEVVGILVAGAPRDFTNRPGGGGCQEIEVIDPVPDGEGETLTAVRAPMDELCAVLPSSEACTGVEADAGAAGVDAGTPAQDASTPRDDAAVVPVDDAAAPPDGGAPDGGPNAGSDGGCGCRAASSPMGRGPLGSFALLALGVWRARRRRAIGRVVG